MTAADAEYNIGRRVVASAARYHGRVALRAGPRSLAYEDLEELIVASALRLRAHGVTPSSCVAIARVGPISLTVLPLSCALLGCSWEVFWPTGAARKQFPVTHVIHDSPKAMPSQPRHIRLDATWAAPVPGRLDDAVATLRGFGSPDDVWMIGNSSGTTGTSKSFVVSAGNASARCDPRLLVDPSDTPLVASMFFPTHIGNYVNIVRVLLKGGTFTFGGGYESWLDAGVTSAIATPSQYAVVLGTKPPPADARIPLAWLGGAPIYPRFVEKMFGYFTVLANTYGSAEAGIVCTRLILDADDAAGPACLGQALPDTAIEIVDDGGSRLPPDAEGIVRYRTPWMVTGYIGDTETSERVFKDGWFYPGDLGFLSAAGDFHFSARANDQLNLGGVKVNAVLLDEAIQATEGVKDGICFGQILDSGVSVLAAIVELEKATDAHAAVASLREQCRRKVGRHAVPGLIYIGSVPRNDNGKANRNQASEAVRGMEPIRLSP